MSLQSSTAKLILLRVNVLLLFSFSYLALLALIYGDRMEKTREACRMAEQTGLSYREAKWVMESDLFLDEYPRWDLGSHIRWSFSMKCSCTWNHEDGRRQNKCAAEATRAK